MQEFRAAHGDALARSTAERSPEGRARFEAHLADEELQEVRAELLDLAWALLRLEITCVLKDGKTGDTPWKDAESLTYTSDSGGSGSILADAINASIVKAAPDDMPLARQANEAAMVHPGDGFPAGPYRADYRKDLGTGIPGAKWGAASAIGRRPPLQGTLTVAMATTPPPLATTCHTPRPAGAR